MPEKAEPLTREFLDRLWAFARGRVRTDADADDVVQDVLMKLVAQGAGLALHVRGQLRDAGQGLLAHLEAVGHQVRVDDGLDAQAVYKD